LDLSLLPLAFSLILTVVSRLLHPYSTNDKTSRLMVKRFSTVRDTQRGSLPEKEFRIMIVKMIQNLGNKNGVTDK